MSDPLELYTFDAVFGQMEDAMNEYQLHKTYFEATNSTIAIGETRYRLAQVLELIPKIKSRYAYLRRQTEFKDDFDALYAPFGDTYNALVGNMQEFVSIPQEHMFESTRYETFNAPTSRSPKVKFPVITLPVFKGDLDKWIEFRDRFESLVNKNSELSKVDKFNYLLSAIQLPPGQQSVLQGFTLSEAAYDDAWNAVCERYNDSKKLKSQHFNSLLTVKKMTSETSVELRRLIDSFSSTFAALDLLDATYDDLRVHVVQFRLDDQTLKDWQKWIDDDEPTWAKMKEFLVKQWRTLDSVPQPVKRQQVNKPSDGKAEKPSTSKAFAASTSGQAQCLLCGEAHFIYQCPKFKAMKVPERYTTVNQHRLCRNCLSPSHMQRNCTSTNRCRVCERNHHTLLHYEKMQSSNDSSENHQQSQQNNNNTVKPISPAPVNYPSRSNMSTSVQLSAKTFAAYTEALLSTVRILVLNSRNEWIQCRALTDSGSQSNYITTSFAKELGIELIPTNQTVIGVNGQTSFLKHRTRAMFHSQYQEYHSTIDCCVSDDITGFLPNRPIDITQLKIPENLFLADPEFHVPGKIDMLLGTGVHNESQLGNVIHQLNMPTLTETKFGWVLGGNFPMSTSSATHLSCFTQLSDSGAAELDEKLDKFMEIEHYGTTSKILSPEEMHCEAVYVNGTTQDVTGRVFTPLPFKDNITQLGSNYANAARQFYFQEKKRIADEELRKLYVEYMDGFISSGHMVEVDPNEKDDGYYLPHHGVKKVSSTTTKLRPVFNASSKSETGLSLNDCLCVGPTVQPESFDILLRFREKAFVLKSDIEKMYRQVFVKPAHTKYQKILWRSSPSEPLRHYILITVTFGVSSAPFLATRTLIRIADENCEDFPNAAFIIRTSFYVDDLVFSFDTIEEGIRLRDQIRYLLASSQFPTRKWSSNDPELLRDLPQNDIETTDEESPIIKTLGLVWDPKADVISFAMKKFDKSPTTKAGVLSEIASIYDPIGFIGPVILKAKLHMKPLRTLKWNEKLPEDEKAKWEEFRSNLEALNDVTINRHAMVSNPVSVQLHGFADASEVAYGAVIYIRSCDSLGNTQISLICSKSRVSPPKQKSIARLELCAATLLAKLITRIAKVLTTNIADVTLWSDSMIVLHWINSMSSRLSTFVGNRVAVIQENTENYKWKHIRSEQNPGDTISRGLMPQEIKNCKLWWNGPPFLALAPSEWPESLLTVNDDDPEVKTEMRKTFLVTKVNPLFTLIETRFSSLKKITHCIAYLRRFTAKESIGQKGSFTIDELHLATENIIRILQETLFPTEYRFFERKLQDPENKEEFPPKSSLLSLSPFMDKNRMIRVGGRICASPELSTQQKHQVILPRCHFAKLVARDMHKKFLHPGQSAMLAYIREYYWPLNAKSIIRQVQHECLCCFRAKPKFGEQIMGNLPAARVTMTHPFVSVAVDYAGPFNLRASLTLKSSIIKGYIAMFKCMCTGAIHLEAVTKLSTAAFIATYDRFISRRGLSKEIFSDNGTEFVGANNEFQRILKEVEPAIGEHLKEKGIKWHFTTPIAPHAGGYYEAGIKTMKQHLTRECANRSFDFEQFTTLLCKIEAIINSRPLTPMTEDPNDLQVLSPAHFLIGRSLIAKPERDFIPVNTGRLDKYNQIQQLQQVLWQRWYREYLHHLQTRPNHFRKENEFKIGDMVLLKDSNLPSLKWLMGRVVATYPDKAGTVRNVLIKTPTGEKHRHVKYLCFLPFEKVQDSSPAGENVRDSN